MLAMSLGWVCGAKGERAAGGSGAKTYHERQESWRKWVLRLVVNVG